MGFTPPTNNDQWAKDKGLKKWCNDHQIWFDRNLGECPEHTKEREKTELAKARESRELGKQALDSLGLQFKEKKKHWWSKQ